MRRAGRLAPPLAVMALIFYLSAQPGLSSGLSFDYMLRKVAHMTIYATLWLTVLRALGWRRPAGAWAIALAYAVSDEVHQHFVADRHGAPLDVGFDAAGMAVAATAWWLVRTRRPRWARRWIGGPAGRRRQPIDA